MKVHSDSKRKPRYYVEHDGKVLVESDDASKVIQWAIGHVIEAEREPSKE